MDWLRDIPPVVQTLGGGVILLYGASNALVRIGLVPSRAINWWQERWTRHMKAVERDAGLDSLLAEFQPNHGSSMRDQVDGIRVSIESLTTESRADRALLHQELATHIEDARFDRQMAAVDRQTIAHHIGSTEAHGRGAQP